MHPFYFKLKTAKLAPPPPLPSTSYTSYILYAKLLLTNREEKRLRERKGRQSCSGARESGQSKKVWPSVFSAATIDKKIRLTVPGASVTDS